MVSAGAFWVCWGTGQRQNERQEREQNQDRAAGRGEEQIRASRRAPAGIGESREGQLCHVRRALNVGRYIEQEEFRVGLEKIKKEDGTPILTVQVIGAISIDGSL